MLTIEQFTATDGDTWFSVLLDEDLATCLIWNTEAEAKAELDELTSLRVMENE